MEDGSRGPEEDGEYIYEDFLSYTYSNESHTACKDNQVITSINISDDIRRWFENKTIKGWKFVFFWETDQTELLDIVANGCRS